MWDQRSKKAPNSKSKDKSFQCLDITHHYLDKNGVEYSEHDSSESLDKIAKNEYYYFLDIPTGIQFGTSSMRTKIYIKVNSNLKDCFDLPRNLICQVIDKKEKENWKVNNCL